jgi:hypothetical protein
VKSLSLLTIAKASTVLAGGEGVLVDGADGAGVELPGPALQPLGGEVAVGALDGRRAVLRQLVEDVLGVAGRDVVGVEQDGDAYGAGVGVHGRTLRWAA